MPVEYFRLSAWGMFELVAKLIVFGIKELK